MYFVCSLLEKSNTKIKYANFTIDLIDIRLCIMWQGLSTKTAFKYS
jgi:hypothetical protein